MGQEKISPIVQEFILESVENIASISSRITDLEKDPTNKEVINELYRAVHTIKGGSGFLKFKNLEAVTHNLENVLDLVRSEKISFDSKITDLALESIDAIQFYIDGIEASGEEPEKKYETLVAKLLGVIESSMTSEQSIAPDSSVGDKIDQLNDVLEKKKREAAQAELDATQANIKENLAKKLKVVEEETAKAAMNGAAPAPKAAKPKPAPVSKPVAKKEADSAPAKVQKATESSLADSVVRVNVNLLDKIMNVVGELVLTRNQILQYANTKQNSELQRLSNQLNVITTELQEDVMTTRMQPIGSVLSRFERIVRDMAKELDKSIELKIEGKQTELDKTLLEAIKDPLTHMIRNSVDHGIEMPADRVANGKGETGTLHINAYHEGGQVTIEIADDGGGISKDKVKEKAVSKGLITQERADTMPDKEVLSLIFLPGFSTAAKVTNISGRGVGMDVVRTNIEKIGGKIEIFSEEGVGTTFKLKIPLTLAIIPALIVNSHQSSFAIPQINLLELVRLNKDSSGGLEEINGAEFFRLRGELVPVIRLKEVLGLTGESTSEDTSENVVVLNSDGKIYGLIVDEILDTVEIVVKPLSKQLKSVNFYAGATIMGDGRVSLILDVNGIAAMKQLSSEKVKEEVVDDMHAAKDVQEMLLFNIFDRPSELFAVPLILVNRLEEFKKQDVEFTGNRPLIHYRGEAMPLFFVNSELGYSSPVQNADNLPDLLPVFVIAVRGSYVGFVVEDIIDITRTDEKVNDKVSDREGVLGTLHIKGKTSSVVDVFNIIERSKIGGDNFSKITEFEHRQDYAGKILVVEDSPMFRGMAVKIVKELGFDVQEARDGLEALNYLQRNNDIDVILSDIEMPQMTGWELAENVRASSDLNSLPMIAITTRYSEADIKKGKESGFDFYLEKLKKEDIQQAIASVMKH